MIENLYSQWSESFNHDSRAWQDMTREEIFLAGVQAQGASQRKSSNNPWSQEDLEAFLQMVDRGCCSAEIASRLGRTRNSIYAKARYFGVKISNASGDDRSNVIISDAGVAQVLRLREIGWSREDVANLMNISVHYVARITNGDRRSTATLKELDPRSNDSNNGQTYTDNPLTETEARA